MDQYIKDFITYLEEVKLASKNTLQAYHNDLKKLQFFLEKQNIYSVAKISETSLNSFVLSLEREGLSPATVSRNIASLKGFLLYLIKKRIILEDPSERLKPPKVMKKSPQVIDSSLVDKLLSSPNLKTKKGIRDRAILELMYATGIKVSEVIALKIGDINLESRFITCGDRRERNIPFGKSAKSALTEYIKLRNIDNAQNQSLNDILFLNSLGEQLSRQGLWKILKTYAKAAGLSDINPNVIRHSFAAHMIENGADLGSVQEFLGHADITTTQLYLTQGYKNSREVYMNTHPRA